MSTVRAPHIPLYQLGALALCAQLRDGACFVPERRTNTVNAPTTPLHQLGAVRLRQHLLGASAPGVIAASGSLVAASTPMLVSTLAPALTAAVPLIGAGIAVLTSVIAGLWAKHDARVAGAKAENAAINSAVSTWDQGMQAIFAAANSSDASQNVSGATAAQMVQQLYQTFWQKMSPLIGPPGTADNSNRGVNCGTYTPDVTQRCSPGHPCTSSCTASCCVGCNDLWPSSLDAISVLQSPNGGKVNVCTVYSSKYGASQRAGYTLTYTPPTITASATAAGVASSISSAAGEVESAATAAGLPSWAPLAAAALALVFLLK